MFKNRIIISMKKHKLLLSSAQLPKRWLMILCVFFAIGQASAQENTATPPPLWEQYPMEVNISTGLMPDIFRYDNYDHGYVYPYNPQNIETYNTFYSPSFNATLSFKINKWLAFGVYYSTGVVTRKSVYTYDLSTALTERVMYHGITPQMRVDWLNRKFVTLYSAAALGLKVNHNRAVVDNVVHHDLSFRVFGDLTLMGIKVGRRWYGLAEVSVANAGFFKMGVGYRFNCKNR